MIINHTHRFIFVHVPKTAGTSIVSALSKFSTYRDLEIGGTPLGEAIQPFMQTRFGLRKHSTSAEIRHVVGQYSFQSYFSFCIVRSPFSRLQSAYHFLRGWKQYPEEFAAEFDKYDSFDAFLKSELWMIKPGPDGIFLPQTHWINDPKSGLPLPRYVGKLEQLDSVVETLSNSIFKIDGAIKIGIKNKTPRYEPISEWPTKMVSKITEFYASDFSQLEYSDDPNEA